MSSSDIVLLDFGIRMPAEVVTAVGEDHVSGWIFAKSASPICGVGVVDGADVKFGLNGAAVIVADGPASGDGSGTEMGPACAKSDTVLGVTATTDAGA